MRRRQITIEGGRYLIFYSFDDEPGLDAAPSSARASGEDAPDGARGEGVGAGDSQPTREPARGSAVEPSAEDERRV
jgi:hypothetical protein